MLLLYMLIRINPIFLCILIDKKICVLQLFNCYTQIFGADEGVEPPRRETLDPKSSASANSATSAYEILTTK